MSIIIIILFPLLFFYIKQLIVIIIIPPKIIELIISVVRILDTQIQIFDIRKILVSLGVKDTDTIEYKYQKIQIQPFGKDTDTSDTIRYEYIYSKYRKSYTIMFFCAIF